MYWDSSLPSYFSLVFRSFQYLRGRSVPVSAAMTSMMEKNHFS